MIAFCRSDRPGVPGADDPNGDLPIVRIGACDLLAPHSMLFDLPGLGQHGKPDELLWISRRSGTPQIEGVGWIPNGS